jgi:hypothetical protein
MLVMLRFDVEAMPILCSMARGKSRFGFKFCIQLLFQTADLVLIYLMDRPAFLSMLPNSYTLPSRPGYRQKHSCATG